MVDDSVHVEPVPGEPAATATIDGARTLFVADYHAGYEAGLRAERGVEVPSQATDRRGRLCSLLDRTAATRLVVLGDLMHSIGDPGSAEQAELDALIEAIPDAIDVTIVKGNHDGQLERWVDGADVVSGDGIALGDVGVCHGHTWPTPAVLDCDVVCLGHEHPCVRLEDEVGGSRVEQAWLRGRCDPAVFGERSAYEGLDWLDSDTVTPPKLVVMPAFNELTGGTWTNVSGQSFLAPFLPAGLADGEAYLLDGTRLGPYRTL